MRTSRPVLRRRLLGVPMEPFEQIVADHGAVVMRVCRALLPPADAEDAWSETFLAALRAYPDLRPGSRVEGWLVTIAHRKAIDQLRRTQRGPSPTGEVVDRPAPYGIPDPADAELRAALDALPPKQRGAVLYHHVAGLPYAEVGELLDSSEVAARRSASDGLANLRRIYLEGANR